MRIVYEMSKLDHAGFLPTCSFVLPLCRAHAPGYRGARRSAFPLLLRTLRVWTPRPKTSLGPCPKQCSLRLGSGALALRVPRQIRATKGKLTCTRTTSISSRKVKIFEVIEKRSNLNLR